MISRFFFRLMPAGRLDPPYQFEWTVYMHISYQPDHCCYGYS